MTHTEVLTWDWREQPDLPELARKLFAVSGGTVHLREIDTGSDEYAIVLASEPITAAQATDAYKATWDVSDDEQ